MILLLSIAGGVLSIALAVGMGKYLRRKGAEIEETWSDEALERLLNDIRSGTPAERNIKNDI